MTTKVDEIMALIADLRLIELHSIVHQLNEVIHELESSSDHLDAVVEKILIDAPLEALATHGTSLLTLKLPFSLPHDNRLRWREINMTRNAQIELITILATHLSDGGRVTEIQLPKVTKQ